MSRTITTTHTDSAENDDDLGTELLAACAVQQSRYVVMLWLVLLTMLEGGYVADDAFGGPGKSRVASRDASHLLLHRQIGMRDDEQHQAVSGTNTVSREPGERGEEGTPASFIGIRIIIIHRCHRLVDVPTLPTYIYTLGKPGPRWGCSPAAAGGPDAPIMTRSPSLSVTSDVAPPPSSTIAIPFPAARGTV
nr:hypothetical protein CFP56_10464 [Quercus suber]